MNRIAKVGLGLLVTLLFVILYPSRCGQVLLLDDTRGEDLHCILYRLPSDEVKAKQAIETIRQYYSAPLARGTDLELNVETTDVVFSKFHVLDLSEGHYAIIAIDNSDGATWFNTVLIPHFNTIINVFRVEEGEILKRDQGKDQRRDKDQRHPRS